MFTRALGTARFPYTSLFRSADWVADPEFGAQSGRRVLRQASGSYHEDTLQFQTRPAVVPAGGALEAWRSEEHTSELQSRGHLVCRLLLEKKQEFAHRGSRLV